MSFKILALSDIHGNLGILRFLEDFPEDFDVLAISGDIGSGRVRATEIVEKLRRLAENIVLVPGNCDEPSEFWRKPLNNLNIHGRHIKLYDYFFIGVGGAPGTPLRKPFELSDMELGDVLKRAYRSLPEGTDSKRVVVLSHTPPRNTRVDRALLMLHAGSRSIREFIMETQPLLCICGHVHEGRGIDRLGETFLVNPGPGKRGYYAIIEVSGVDVEVRLGRWGR